MTRFEFNISNDIRKKINKSGTTDTDFLANEMMKVLKNLMAGSKN